MPRINELVTSKETSYCLSDKLALSYTDLLVRDIKVCSHVTFTFVSISTVVSDFNSMLMVMKMQGQTMGVPISAHPFSVFAFLGIILRPIDTSCQHLCLRF